MSLVETEVAPPATEQDEPTHTHVVVPKDAVMEAMVNGTPVTAICGHTWVPSRDPKRYPVCPECRRLMAEIGVEL